MQAHAFPPSRSSTRLYDPMTDIEPSPSSPLPYPLYWYECVLSTMDTAKELVTNEPSLLGAHLFAVGTDTQLNGRGTRGRDWKSSKKNLMLTVAIRKDLLPIPITLLPLRIGTLIASSLTSYIKSSDLSQLKLKWPNDLLIEGAKICGTLIEMEGDYLLIGIGCNILSAPNLPPSEARQATYLAKHSNSMKVTNDEEDDEGKDTIILQTSVDGSISLPSSHPITTGRPVMEDDDYHKEIALAICNRIHDWLHSQYDTAELVRDDVMHNLDTGLQRLRDEPNDAMAAVQPLRINTDGTLLVKRLYDEKEFTLVAEYLW